MGLWTIRGGNRLYGTLQVQGSANAALPILAACVVHKGISVLERVPRVTDVEQMLCILRGLGCIVKREGDRVTVDSSEVTAERIPFEAMSQLRSSLLLLGAMCARFGRGAVPMPRVSKLGPRPVDLHIHALHRMGAELRLTDEAIVCAPCAMYGGEVLLAYPSVGATENAMLAACGCGGETVLRNCAADPEIVDLAAYLRKAGMQISGEGTDTMVLRREKTIGIVRHRLQADRAAAATMLCAVASCGGKVTLQEVFSPHLYPMLDGLEEMGCNIKMRENSVTLYSDGRLWSAVKEFVTGAYPAFPTDMQPLMMAASLRADGVSVFRERVFAGRLAHAKQLRRFGGDITLTDDCAAYVLGVSKLHAAHVAAADLRGGAALLIAALQSEGESRIVDGNILPRGYEFLDGTLRLLGADFEYTD